MANTEMNEMKREVSHIERTLSPIDKLSKPPTTFLKSTTKSSNMPRTPTSTSTSPPVVDSDA